MKHYIKYHFPWQFIMVVIFALSSIPGDSLPEIEFRFADKILHFLVYGILGAFVFKGLRSSKRFFLKKNSIILAILICSIYGAFDELHQAFVPGRFVSFSDWVADVIGIIIFVIMLSFLILRGKVFATTMVKIQKNEQEQAGDPK